MLRWLRPPHRDNMKPKVLCICQGGNCRSAGLATALKGTYGCDALNAGTSWQEPDTMYMLCRWANIIILVEPRVLCEHSKVNQPAWDACVVWDKEFVFKRKIFDVGADIWGNPLADSYQTLIHSRKDEFLPWIEPFRS